MPALLVDLMVRVVPHIVAPGQAVRISRDTILVCFVLRTGEIFKGGETVCVYVPALLLHCTHILRLKMLGQIGLGWGI